MLTTKRLNILQRAFAKANYSGLQDTVHPPQCLASEVLDLITRKDTATSRHASQKIKNSFSRKLPPKKTWHPPLTMIPLCPVPVVEA